MAYDGYAYGKAEADVQMRPLYDHGGTSSHSDPHDHHVQPLPSDASQAEVAQLHHEDSRIKKHIRTLRFVSRIVAHMLSSATMGFVGRPL